FYVADYDRQVVLVFNPDGTFKDEFRASNPDNNSFWYPSGIAVDDAGTIYVTDVVWSRVFVLGPDGTLKRTIGTGGTGEGQFDTPNAITVASNGDIIVVDAGNDRIQVFNPDGSFQRAFGTKGRGEGQFFTPVGIAVDNAGNFYVVERDRSIVQKFDSMGNYLATVGSSGLTPGSFSKPSGITEKKSKTGTESEVVVADKGYGRVQVFDSVGVYLDEFGAYGSEDGKFDTPLSVEFFNFVGSGKAVAGSDSTASFGDLLVADAGNNRIQVFDPDYNVKFTFGELGSDPGQLFIPFGIAVDPAGRILVADALNNRVQVFDSTGVYLFAFGELGSGPGEFTFPSGLTVSWDGWIYVVDRYNHRVQVFDAEGVFLFTFGSFGEGDGQFNEPLDVAVDDDGRIYVTDSQNHRVQVFAYVSTGVEHVSSEIPEAFHLAQNYPNPFNPATTIEFALPSRSQVGLRVFDVLGREVAVLVEETLLPGAYQVEFAAVGLPSGVYLYRLETPAGSFVQTMQLVK
ncbi:MAG: 6-bladed beta-propeller, partial [Rhodothermales bacterium]